MEAVSFGRSFRSFWVCANHFSVMRSFSCLESQPSLDAIRADNGGVPRKPLKHRKGIDPRWFRYVPVFDEAAWNLLARRANTQVTLYESRKFGDDLRNYLLFDGLTASMFYGDLQKAFARAKVRPRGPHKLRHTFLTWFYDAISDDNFLAEAVAGHRDKAMMEIYSHSAEQRGREALARKGIKLFSIRSLVENSSN
ncbi:MAG: site-specific integrase [Oligoflexia bacterium]|nr:site-specific integrase [Oligoflexia bacterium]